MNDEELDGPIPENELPWYHGLTDRQRRFVEEWAANGMNQVRAAMGAGFADNYDSARTISSRLFANVNIKAAKDKYLDSLSASTNELVKRLEGMSKGSVDVFTRLETTEFEGKKTTKRVLDLTTPEAIENLYLIKEIDADGSIKLHDSKDATKLLLQMRGALVKNHKHFGDEDLPPIRNTVTVSMSEETMLAFDKLFMKQL